MIEFNAIIKKDLKSGEKMGWTYIEIPFEIAQKINEGRKTAYRVKGKVENVSFRFTSLNPVGKGNFILALNNDIRKNLKKVVGEKVSVSLELETEEMPMNNHLMATLELDPEAFQIFSALPNSHKRYYSNWIDTAKSPQTIEKRIEMTIYGLLNQMDFGQMIRYFKSKKNE